MSGRERRKAEIVSRLAAGGLDVKAASEMLGVGERQAYRLQARFRQEGLAAVKHGNAGRPAHNRTDPALVERIVSLAGPGGKYQDLNVSHLQEMLAEVEQIAIGRSTLDRLLHQAGVRQRGRRAQRVHRRRRERRPAEGMLLQIDGSPFACWKDAVPRARCWARLTTPPARCSICTSVPARTKWAICSCCAPSPGSTGCP